HSRGAPWSSRWNNAPSEMALKEVEEPMSFEIGQRYERQSDGVTAVVVQIDIADITDMAAKTVLLRASTSEEEWITAADLPARWRLFSAKPESIPKAQKAWGLAWRTIPSPSPATMKAAKLLRGNAPYRRRLALS